MAAIERGVFDPLAQPNIVPQGVPNAQAKITGVSVHKARRYAAIATVPVNEPDICGSGFPGGLHNPRQRLSANVVGMISTADDDNFFGKATPYEPSATRWNHAFMSGKAGIVMSWEVASHVSGDHDRRQRVGCRNPRSHAAA